MNSPALPEFETALMRKIMWRLLPFLCLCFMAAFLDRVNVGFADSASDQLGVLGTEVDDENRHPMPTRCAFCRALPSVCTEGASMISAFWNAFTSE